MKTVFPNSMVAHVWAQQNQSSGRSGNGNLSFNDATLYSYSTAIANFVKDKDGFSVVLVSKERYSVTTAHHIGLAQSATRGTPSFTVPHLLSASYYSDADKADQHMRNVRELLVEYFDDIERAKRMRNDPSWLLETAEENLHRIEEYARRFNVAFPIAGFVAYGKRIPEITEFPDSQVQTAEVLRIHGERANRAADPKAIAKAEKARQRKDLKTREEYRTVTGRFSSGWNEYQLPYRSRESTLALFTDEDKAARALVMGEIAESARQAYRHGEIDYCSHATEDDQEAHRAAVRESNRQALELFRAGENIFVSPSAISEGDRIARDSALRLKPAMQTLIAKFCDGDASVSDISREESGIILTDSERAQHDSNYFAAMERRIVRWREGEQVSISRGAHALMRLRGDLIETSWGATFPVAHARQAWPLLKACNDAGRAYHRNGHTIHLGHFAIDSYDPATGILRAGCHTVQWAEIELMACRLGLLADID